MPARKVLIPSLSGLQFKPPFLRIITLKLCLNPFFIRSAVQTAIDIYMSRDDSLNPFFIRSAVQTEDAHVNQKYPGGS